MYIKRHGRVSSIYIAIFLILVSVDRVSVRVAATINASERYYRMNI